MKNPPTIKIFKHAWIYLVGLILAVFFILVFFDRNDPDYNLSKHQFRVDPGYLSLVVGSHWGQA